MVRTNFSHSLSDNLPLRIFHISISVCSDRIRAASCCAAISKEKNSTGAPRGYTAPATRSFTYASAQ